uniref:MATA-HMG n=2 Tax=Rhizophagus irregularis TaxID=588596 RepID=A0A1B1EUP5_9GLOM|nr:MATA-HMG [Rhizophagus irregularis]
MQQVVAKLKAIITKTNGTNGTNGITEYSQVEDSSSNVIANSVTSAATSSINNSLHGELSGIIENFGNMELESNNNNSSVSSNISTIEKVVKILSTVNDADGVINITVPFPPQITAEEILDRNKTKERKKVPNKFMIYRMAYAKELKTQNISNINSFNISVLAASRWSSEPDEVKQAYKDISNRVRQLEIIRNSIDSNTVNT